MAGPRTPLRVGRRPGRPAAEPGLQAEDRLRVELRDTGLGDAEHLPDLAERELLVVVERDDELLSLGETRYRLAERLSKLRLRHRGLRFRRLRVLDRVD